MQKEKYELSTDINIDESLAKVKYENRFSQKLEDANAFLAKAGVPKTFLMHSDEKQILPQYSSAKLEKSGTKKGQ